MSAITLIREIRSFPIPVAKVSYSWQILYTRHPVQQIENAARASVAVSSTSNLCVHVFLFGMSRMPRSFTTKEVIERRMQYSADEVAKIESQWHCE